MIIRVQKDKRYFHASNEPFQDAELGFQETAIMGYLLSKPDDWQVSNTDLANRFDCSTATIKRAIGRLKERGYVRRYKRRDSETGQFVWHTDIYESPSLNPDFIEDEDPSVTGELWPSVKTHRSLVTDIQSTDIQNTTPPREREEWVVAMINALVDVTGLDGHRFYGTLREEAENLVDGQYLPSDLKVHYGREPVAGRWNWYENHWKGRKGDFPMIEDLWESISGATKWTPVEGNGRSPTPDKHETLKHITQLVGRYGRRDGKAAISELSASENEIVKQMGGWYALCNMSEEKIRITYFQALKGLEHA